MCLLQTDMALCQKRTYTISVRPSLSRGVTHINALAMSEAMQVPGWQPFHNFRLAHEIQAESVMLGDYS